MIGSFGLTTVYRDKIKNLLRKPRDLIKPEPDTLIYPADIGSK